MVSVIVPVAPTASPVSSVQVTTWPATVHDQPSPVPARGRSPSGTVSTTVTGPGSSVGPLLVTVSVQVGVGPDGEVTGVRLGDGQVDEGRNGERRGRAVVRGVRVGGLAT